MILATLLWLFVSTNETATTQRGLLVPIVVTGVEDTQVAIGVPELIEVTVSGPSSRVDRLGPENIEAVLDLSGLEGEFERAISVLPPQGITLVNVNPSDVTGRLEAVLNKPVPVEVVLLSPLPDGLLLDLRSQPQQVIASGPSGPLDRTVRAIAAITMVQGTTQVNLFPADAGGQTVRDIVLLPSVSTVTAASRQALVIKEVAVEFVRPNNPALVGVIFETDRLPIAGPAVLLDTLESVQATVELTTPYPTTGTVYFPCCVGASERSGGVGGPHGNAELRSVASRGVTQPGGTGGLPHALLRRSDTTQGSWAGITLRRPARGP